MMRLFIAEKPDLAKDIVKALSNGKEPTKKDGYFEIGEDCVTWCFGHILEMKNPTEIDPDYKNWKLESLPLKLHPLQMQPIEEKKKQVAIIGNLLKKAEIAVNAGDPDDEGNLLVDEVLKYFNFKGKELRILINDNTNTAIKKALTELQPNENFKGLTLKALSRQTADAIHGLSLTRACTVITGNKGLISIGRVQTPIFAMIAKRYLDFNNHSKSFYYELKAIFNNTLNAVHNPKESAPFDENKRITNRAYLDEIQNKISNKPGTVKSVKNEQKETSPPLPFNLIKLQQEMNKKHGYTASQTLDITQKLREKHKAITYNRSDCSYLSEDQYKLAPNLVNSLKQTFSLELDFNTNLKSKAFDSSKITAHTAIIPTDKKIDMNTLTQDEKNVYTAISTRFLVQFLPNQKFDLLTVDIAVDDELFQIKAKSITDNGYKTFLTDEDQDEPEEKQSNFAELSQSKDGDNISLTSLTVEEKTTKPKPLFTEASLLSSLVRVADFVEDPKIKELLKSKDKDKKDEHGGIGTPATRHSMIELLKKRGYIELKGKNLIPTPKGIELYNFLPDALLSVDTTALMFEKQVLIQDGKLTIDEFIEETYKNVENLVEILKTLNSSELQKFNTNNGNENSNFDCICPCCNGKLNNSTKAINCPNPQCKFVLFKTISQKTLTDAQIKKLLTKKETSIIKGFISKAGKEFEARLKLNDEKKVDFVFSEKK